MGYLLPVQYFRYVIGYHLLVIGPYRWWNQTIPFIHFCSFLFLFCVMLSKSAACHKKKNHRIEHRYRSHQPVVWASFTDWWIWGFHWTGIDLYKLYCGSSIKWWDSPSILIVQRAWLLYRESILSGFPSPRETFSLCFQRWLTIRLSAHSDTDPTVQNNMTQRAIMVLHLVRGWIPSQWAVQVLS